MNLRSKAQKVKYEFGISLLDYYIKYENFKIPKCKFCDKDAKLKSGLTFIQTCGSNECIRKTSYRKHSEQTKKILRKKRLAYMKANPEKTAWRQKNMSYPEKIFFNKILDLKLNEKHLIVREFSVFPFFIDFAFVNEKVAIEIDGSQHLELNRKKRDEQKDKLLKDNGWRVLRITAVEVQTNTNDVFKKVLIFLKSTKTFTKIGLLEYKNYKKKFYFEKKSYLNIEKKKQQILKSNINFQKKGWNDKAKLLLNIKKINQWMYIHMADFYKSCYIENKKQTGAYNSQYGTCWITNEKESKKIHKGDIIPDGWRLGRKTKNIGLI